MQPEPLLLAVPEDHALARPPVVPVERLAGEPIILFPHALEPLLYRYLVSDVLGRSRVAPSVVLEATTLESACSAVAARLGVAFVGEPPARNGRRAATPVLAGGPGLRMVAHGGTAT